MRKSFVITLICLTALLLSACSPANALLDLIAPTEETVSIPEKMVVQIDVVTNPYDETLVRSYASQDHMTSLLRMLQNMTTTQQPEEKITFDSYSQYYTITATYVSGAHTVYHLLDGMYLRSEGEPWCVIDSVKFQEFEQYLLDYPTGDAAQLPTDFMASNDPA